MKACFLCIFTMLTTLTAFSQNFPAFTVIRNDTTNEGYYFMVPIKSTRNTAAIDPFHMIIDRNGKVVYYKEFGLTTNTIDFKIQPNGLMSYFFQNRFWMMDSTFTIVDSVRTKNGITTDPHDFTILPNGNFLMLGFENLTEDLSAYNLFLNNGTAGSTTASVKCGVVQELDPGKNVVFEWHASAHFNFLDVDTNRLLNPNIVDWTHCNAIRYDSDGNLLLSSRHFNEITKINRSTGAVMWRMGGNANQFNFTNDPEMTIGQHDAHRLDNGNLLLLDNGGDRTPFHPVRAKEYTLDEANLTATLAWSHLYDSAIYSNAIGNVQRLDNGHTVINYGNLSTVSVQPAFEELDANGNLIYSITFPDTLTSYRVFNYPTLPWTLPRPQLTCYEQNGQHYLDAGSGHAQYLWSTGETTQSILITDTGEYSVFVPIGQGGFISSETFHVTDMADPCNTLSNGVNEQSTNGIIIYPNPSSGNFEISGLDTGAKFELYDLSGKLKFEGTYSGSTSFDRLAKGIYHLRIKTTRAETDHKLVIQ